MRILSHPFRLAANGEVATVEQNSDGATAEQLAVLILTRRGERALVPAFGVTDPTFDRLSAAEVSAGVEMFGPAARIEAVETVWHDETTREVTVRYAES